MKRLLLLLPLACFAQDVVPVVCPDCNREALEAPWLCPKCGKQLEPPAVAPDPDPEDAPDAPAEPDRDIASAIRESARFAKAGADADPACALAAARNALALSALAPDALSPADHKRLVTLETSLLARLAAEIAPCQHCHGTGRVDAPRPPKPASRGKNYTSLESVAVKDLNAQPTQTCPLCGGSGKVRRATDRKRLAGLVGEGVRDFSIRARGTGRQEPFGQGVWLPLGVLASLSDADRAAIAAASHAAHTCPACAGTGTQPCRSCGGIGRVLCGNRAFHSPPKPVGEGADRKAIESTVLAPSTRDPCPVCGGTWDAPRAVACHDCSGRGVSACSSCSGTGSR